MKCFASTNGFWIDPQGYIRPCARNKVRQKHISEYEDFANIKFTDIVSDLKNNNFPESCFRCKLDEDKGIRSKRQYYDAVGMLAPDDFMIDISMGNFCNLKCRMCNPRNSTLWYNEHKDMVDLNLVEEKIDNKAYKLTDLDIEKLIKFLETVKGNIYLELKGGEPLLMPETKKFIDQLKKLPNLHRITLLLVTNGTVVPNWVEDFAKQIKTLELIISLDGIDTVFNYIRGNNKFTYNECYNNIVKFSKMKNIQLGFNVVVQNTNIHQLQKIHTVLSKFTDEINYITLMLPEYYRVNNLKDAYKEKVKKSIDTEKFGKHEQKIKSIINFMMQNTTNKLYAQFINITKYLDNSRSQRINDIISESDL